MRLFPEFATSLICVSLMAACQNSNHSVTADMPASDQAAPADIVTSTPSPAPSEAATTESTSAKTAAAKTLTHKSAKHMRKTAKHSRKHGRTVAHNHRKHRHNVTVNTKTPPTVATADIPQSDRQAERDEFKRQMQWRVANIGSAVSRYHNSASITDGLTRYEQKIEDIKVADAMARRQLQNISSVSNENWPSFKTSFQDQVSQLERDYQGLRTASR